jgi:DNA mismatch repair protein MutL
MARLKEKEFTSQSISPPIMLSLDAREEEMLTTYRPQIERLGYVIEHFGGREYMISAVPDNLFSIDGRELFLEMLDDFANLSGKQTPELILEKVASMSCKAAVKGNDTLSLAEIDALIGELLTLENPFNCPHGRPTIISMSKYEIEKKFKRIVS